MSVWSKRDMLVLRWLHDEPPEDGALSTNFQSETPHKSLPDLSERDVHVSVETLADAGLVDFAQTLPDSVGGVLWTGFQVSGVGLQAIGEWPVFEMLETPEGLGRLLDAFADVTSSDEEKRNLRAAAATARSKSPEVLRRLATAAISGLVRSHIG